MIIAPVGAPCISKHTHGFWCVVPGWPDMQIMLCATNCHTKKTAYGNAISSLFFLYGHSVESLSAINLYGQLMTFMVFCMVILWCSCFHVFFNFFSTNNSIYYLNSFEEFERLENFKHCQWDSPSATLRV